MFIVFLVLSSMMTAFLLLNIRFAVDNLIVWNMYPQLLWIWPTVAGYEFQFNQMIALNLDIWGLSSLFDDLVCYIKQAIEKATKLSVLWDA